MAFFFDNLLKLQKYLIDRDEFVQFGAVIFWKSIINAFFVPREIGTKFEILRKIRFDPIFSLNLIQDNNNEKSLSGIVLLTLSNYPIQNQEYQQTLLTLIQESINTQKENAWIRFLRETPIQETNQDAWCSTLQNILDESGHYSRRILSVAMERYQKLVSMKREAPLYL